MKFVFVPMYLFCFLFQAMFDLLEENCLIDPSNFNVDVVIEKPPQVST